MPYRPTDSVLTHAVTSCMWRQRKNVLCAGIQWAPTCVLITVWHAFDLLRWWTQTGARPIECSERNARSLGVQLSFRWNPCPDLFCPLLIKRNTTRRSLIVPTVTSSFNWEEVGLRSCSVGDRTRVPSGVGSRRCARSEGEPRPHNIGSTLSTMLETPAPLPSQKL